MPLQHLTFTWCFLFDSVNLLIDNVFCEFCGFLFELSVLLIRNHFFYYDAVRVGIINALWLDSGI